jgi:hypothetical protein
MNSSPSLMAGSLQKNEGCKQNGPREILIPTIVGIRSWPAFPKANNTKEDSSF